MCSVQHDDPPWSTWWVRVWTHISDASHSLLWVLRAILFPSVWERIQVMTSSVFTDYPFILLQVLASFLFFLSSCAPLLLDRQQFLFSLIFDQKSSVSWSWGLGFLISLPLRTPVQKPLPSSALSRASFSLFLSLMIPLHTRKPDWGRSFFLSVLV